MEFLLINNRAFPWHRDGYIWAKGYLYDTKNCLFQGAEIATYFHGVANEEDFRQKVRDANGSFLVIVKIGNVCYVAVDRLRSMLLFIAQKDDCVFISDDAPALRDRLELGKSDLDSLKVEEFRQSGYTVGSSTIYKTIAQLRGGEYAVVTDAGYRIHYYYEHTHGNFFDVSREEAFRMLDGVTERMFRRLIDSVDGRQIVVPLSGGYDSRYIVAALKKYGYKNVCCFTYGRTDSFEVQTSRQVAEKLSYEWHFVEYTPETWGAIFTDEWLPFYAYAGQLSQVPHCQDIYAVKYLLDQGVIHKDAVIVPGYCGDGLGGSYVTAMDKIEQFTPRFLAQSIASAHFNFLHDNPMQKEIEEDICASFSSKNVSTFDSYNSVSEAWFTINRWSKFVVNALRGYDYFGLEWRMPLWDNELMEFWYRVPNEHRGQPTWYDGYLLEGLFKDEGIDFRKHGLADDKPQVFSALRKIKRGLKHLLSDSMIEKLQRCILPSPGDFNAFSGIYMSLSDKVRSVDRDNIRNLDNPNAILSLWYLQEIANIC